MYIKTVTYKDGRQCRYVYYNVDGVEICLGYLDKYNNLVIYSRNK